MYTKTARMVVLAAVGGMLAVPATAMAADRLGGYGIDTSAISVSGISSGGYMAQQFQVVHSNEVMGAGIVAGGPYDCADNKPGWPPVFTAMAVCSHTIGAMFPFMGPPDVPTSIAATKSAAQAGTIDPTQGLKDDRVFLFSGVKDSLVPPSVMSALHQYYEKFIPADHIKYVHNIHAEHAMVTDGYGSKCDYLGSPYINNCGYDTAGEILRFIYGDLKPPGDPATGKIIGFDQAEFLPAQPISMAETGQIFVPADCQTGAGCRLHVAFHGCLQDQQAIGDAYYANAGYNRWAATNKIIVLYPQTVASSTIPYNPNACWDFWGYTDVNFNTNGGQQIVAIQKMIDRVASRPVSN